MTMEDKRSMSTKAWNEDYRLIKRQLESLSCSRTVRSIKSIEKRIDDLMELYEIVKNYFPGGGYWRHQIQDQADRYCVMLREAGRRF